jgi:hypothetical protein
MPGDGVARAAVADDDRCPGADASVGGDVGDAAHGAGARDAVL